MNIVDAFKKYKKIRRKIWASEITYIFVKRFESENISPDLGIYLRNILGNTVNYSLLSTEVIADDWEEYKENKDRKVVDCICEEYDPRCVVEERIRLESKGWTNIDCDSEYTLKMVKYED